MLSNGATYDTRMLYSAEQIFLLMDPSRHPAWQKRVDADQIARNRYISKFRNRFGWTAAGEVGSSEGAAAKS